MADKKKIKSEASSSSNNVNNGRGESVVIDVGRRRSSCGYCKSGSNTSITHGYPGMPSMVAPPGAPMPGQVNPSMPGQVNPSMAGQVSNGVPRPMMVPGGSRTPTSGAPPMFTPSMYQVSPTAPSFGGFETSNNNAQSLDANH